MNHIFDDGQERAAVRWHSVMTRLSLTITVGQILTARLFDELKSMGPILRLVHSSRESECEAKFVTTTMVHGKYPRRRFAKVEHISTWANNSLQIWWRQIRFRFRFRFRFRVKYDGFRQQKCGISKQNIQRVGDPEGYHGYNNDYTVILYAFSVTTEALILF